MKTEHLVLTIFFVSIVFALVLVTCDWRMVFIERKYLNSEDTYVVGVNRHNLVAAPLRNNSDTLCVFKNEEGSLTLSAKRTN